MYSTMPLLPSIFVQNIMIPTKVKCHCSLGARILRCTGRQPEEFLDVLMDSFMRNKEQL